MTQKSLGVGRRIAFYRKKEGISARDLALDAGTSRSVIANIENGRREDITVSELLSISRVLRVPPVALLFDISRPMAPVSTPNESESDRFLRPRTIDIVDWVAGIDGPAQWSEDRALMEEELAQNGPAIIGPFGLIVEAAYGESGWDAIRLLTVGRQLRDATEQYAELTREFAADVRHGEFGWEPNINEHLSIMDSVDNLPKPHALERLDGFLEKVKREAPKQYKEAEKSVSELKKAEKQIRNLSGVLKTLGGSDSQFADSDEEPAFPAFGHEQILTLWTKTKSKYMRDLVEGELDTSKYRTADQITRAIQDGVLVRKPIVD